MGLSRIYEQKLAEARQEGINEGIQQAIQEGMKAERRTFIEELLRVRFASIDGELNRIIEPLSSLSPEELTPLLLQLTREELLDRFL
ncbi:hypothetical protein NIES2100_32010 [Calothrix sp. NIES-2100]|uniref:hypothetical protein n=1 Tax=Calothrix sp. NIES-2100 TaxID=1954172 RepID=UPI000B605259|nr:hypothetical protein NIES2100_32010 [Calothrix sp. NIES-2100]